MSGFRCKAGKWEIEFLTIPRGDFGSARVKVAGSPEAFEVRWRRDASGIWIETPRGYFGYDLDGVPDDEGNLQFAISRRNGFEQWEGASYRRAGEQQISGGAGTSKKGMRIRAQMPGKIVRILVAEGAEVGKDQPVIVMEAMKMENEIRAAHAGVVKAIKVTEGQAVETGADLVILE